MNKEHLKTFVLAGLTEEQAQVYDVLLKNKGLQANRVYQLCGIERTFAYKILNQLILLKLAQKQETKGQVTIFTAEHPQRIIELAEEKRQIAENAHKQIESEIGDVFSTYNLTIGKPSIQFMEGISGLKKLHQDIYKSRKDIKLFRSALDKTHAESRGLINEQRKVRVPLGLKTKIIGPLPNNLNMEDADEIREQKAKDASLLVDRRVVDNFEIPAQILIYGNKVAITDYKNNIVTTIIENDNVRETFEKIFDHVFNSSRKL